MSDFTGQLVANTAWAFAMGSQLDAVLFRGVFVLYIYIYIYIYCFLFKGFLIGIYRAYVAIYGLYSYIGPI